MTPKQMFSAAYQRTLVATRASLDPAHFEECWRAVQAFHASMFDEAATRLNASATFLPKPAEWLEVCRAIDGERSMQEMRERAAAADAYLRDRTYHCPVCLDTGFEYRFCSENRQRWPNARPTDRYVTECECRATNPIWQKRLDARRANVQGKQRAA